MTRPWPLTTPSPGTIWLLHAEVGAAVRDELVHLLERAGIEEPLDALARGQLALFVLLAQPLFAAAELGEPVEVREFFDGIHGAEGRPQRHGDTEQSCFEIRQFVLLCASVSPWLSVVHQASTHGLLSEPTPSTFTIMRSPGLRGPTPDGVPVVMMSPGSSVQKRLT